MPRVKIILYYHHNARFALNVIAGALESDPDTATIPVVFPPGPEELIAAIHEAVAAGDKVVVGWSFYSAQFEQMAAELASVKKQTSSVRVLHIAGGVHISADPHSGLQAGFDYTAVGEGEQIIVDLCKALLEEKSLDDIQGLASLDQGRFRRNGRGAVIDLDDYAAGSHRYGRYGPIEITRGCIYACRFCQTPFINKARFRHRSLDNIADQVRRMHAFGMRDFRFISPSSLSYGSTDESVSRPAIEALLATIRDIIGRSKRIFFGTFPSEIRPEHVSREILAIIRKYADNDNLIIGGQSGSPAQLEATHRGHDVDSIVRAVDLAIAAGFRPNVDFLYGLPDETPRDAELTRQLAQTLTDMGARVHAHTFMPLPGTPFQHKLPSVIEAPTRAQILHLTARGKAYGKWQQQIAIGHRLAGEAQAKAGKKTPR